MQFHIKSPIVLASIVVTLGFAVARADMEKEPTDASHFPETAVALTMDQEVEVLLLRCGIDPVCLAAVGLTAESAQSLLAAQQAGLEHASSLLADLDATYAEARRKVDALRRRVQSGLATDDEIQALAHAKVAYNATVHSRDSHLAAVVSSLTAELTSDQKAAIKNIIASKQWKHLPMKYRVEERSETQWVELRNALSAKRTHEKIGEDAPAQAAALIVQQDAEQPVAQAKANCDSCLAGVEGLWSQVFASDH